MESNKLLIQSRGKPAMIKSINVKVPGAFSRKGIGPIMAPSANLYEHIDISQFTAGTISAVVYQNSNNCF